MILQKTGLPTLHQMSIRHAEEAQEHRHLVALRRLPARAPHLQEPLHDALQELSGWHQ